MENQDILELINAFLDEELSEDQAREVERRMAEDAEFRKGVALQKDLRSAYRQSGRIRLRNRMAEIMEEPIPEEDNNVPSTKNKAMPFGKWLLLLAAIVIVLLATWFFSRPEKTDKIIDPPTTEQNNRPTSEDADAQVEEEITPTEENQQSPEGEETISSETRPPIAMADPADFAPNPAMEAMIGGEFRSEEDLSLLLTKPAEDAFFKLQGGESQTVPIAGTLSGLEAGDQLNLVLLFFDNKDANNPILEFPFEVEGADEEVTFDLSPSLNSRPGLYYFMIETEEGDVLTVGKFKIE
jgi:hypothetical protein